MITIIWISLVVLTLWYGFVLTRDFFAHINKLEKLSTIKTALIGFGVNFFDVLRIGAFAPQTALLKFTKHTVKILELLGADEEELARLEIE